MKSALDVIALIALICILPVQYDIFGQSIENKSNSSSKERKLDLIDSLPNSSKRYALIIGADKYEDSKISSLSGATNDAKALASAVIQYAGFPPDQVILLTTDQLPEQQPKRNIILVKLANLAAAAKKDGGMLLVSFAGHGIEREGHSYLLSSDAQLGIESDIDLLEQTAVSVNKIKEKLHGLDQVIIILDACRNDPNAGRASASNPLTDSFARGFSFDVRNKEVKAFATLYATSPGQISFEYKEKKQGYFTWALVEALKGNTPEIVNEKGEITLGSLVAHLKARVPKLVAINAGRQQEPHLIIEGYKPEQLVIALKVDVGIDVSPIPEKLVLTAVDYYYRGFNYYKKDNYNSAIAEYSQAIRLKPDYLEAYINRGIACYKKGDYDNAITDFTQAIWLKPNYAEIYNSRGSGYYKKGDYDNAIADFTQAITLKPDYAEAYNNRGLAYTNKSDYYRAIADCTKAIRLKPDYAYAYYNRGLAYKNKGLREKAIADFKKVVELNNDSDALDKLHKLGVE